jgi:hypothetical protein
MSGRDASSEAGWRQTPEARRVPEWLDRSPRDRKEQTVSTKPSVSSARDIVREVAPTLIDLSEKVLDARKP